MRRYTVFNSRRVPASSVAPDGARAVTRPSRVIERTARRVRISLDGMRRYADVFGGAEVNARKSGPVAVLDERKQDDTERRHDELVSPPSVCRHRAAAVPSLRASRLPSRRSGAVRSRLGPTSSARSRRAPRPSSFGRRARVRRNMRALRTHRVRQYLGRELPKVTSRAGAWRSGNGPRCP